MSVLNEIVYPEPYPFENESFEDYHKRMQKSLKSFLDKRGKK